MAGQAARRREATVRRLRRRYRRAASRIKGPARRGSGRQGGQRRRTWCCGRAWPRRASRRPRSPRSAVTLTITLTITLHYHAHYHTALSRSTSRYTITLDARWPTLRPRSAITLMLDGQAHLLSLNHFNRFWEDVAQPSRTLLGGR